MANLWNVISNSGEHLILERGPERLDIEKPEDPLAYEIFLKLVTGSTASDIGVDLLLRPFKKLPKRAGENDAGASSILERPAGDSYRFSN